MNSKNIFQNIRTIAVVAGVCVSLSLGQLAYGQSWSNPPANPPANNTAAPLNVSSLAQVKTGVLDLRSLKLTHSSPNVYFHDTNAGNLDYRIVSNNSNLYFQENTSDDPAAPAWAQNVIVQPAGHTIFYNGIDARRFSRINSAGMENDFFAGIGRPGNGTWQSGGGGIIFKLSSAGVESPWPHAYGARLNDDSMVVFSTWDGSVGSTDNIFFNVSRGSVGIGAQAATSNRLRVNGSAVASAWNTSSDERLKTNVVELQQPLDMVAAIRGVHFNWKSDGSADIGVIAQEIQKVMPEIVSTDDEGMLTVDYSRLTPVLIESVKELSAQNEELEARVAALEAKLQ